MALVGLADSAVIEGEGFPLSCTKNYIIFFQCANCRIALGDSLAYVCSDDELGTISFRAASSIDILHETTTSSRGKDAGSAYSAIKCQQCRAEVGRLYRTTPRSLDSVRDLISFYREALCSYEAGKYSVFATDDGIVRDSTPSMPDSSSRLAEHEEQLFKVKAMLLMHNEHLARLEEFRQHVVASAPTLVSIPFLDVQPHMGQTAPSQHVQAFADRTYGAGACVNVDQDHDQRQGRNQDLADREYTITAQDHATTHTYAEPESDPPLSNTSEIYGESEMDLDGQQGYGGQTQARDPLDPKHRSYAQAQASAHAYPEAATAPTHMGAVLSQSCAGIDLDPRAQGQAKADPQANAHTYSGAAPNPTNHRASHSGDAEQASDMYRGQRDLQVPFDNRALSTPVTEIHRNPSSHAHLHSHGDASVQREQGSFGLTVSREGREDLSGAARPFPDAFRAKHGGRETRGVEQPMAGRHLEDYQREGPSHEEFEFNQSQGPQQSLQPSWGPRFKGLKLSQKLQNGSEESRDDFAKGEHGRHKARRRKARQPSETQ